MLTDIPRRFEIKVTAQELPLALLSAQQQLRQLGEVGRRATRLVSGKQFCGSSPAGLILEIHIRERLPGRVADDVQGGGKRRMGVMIAPFPLCAESDAQPS